MLDAVQIETARSSGVLFVCALCTKWHRGQDVGLKNRHGDGRCMSISCKSVLAGGSFGDYEGPLKGHLTSFCHVCGVDNPEHAVEPNVAGSRRIGCCAKCLGTLKGMTVEPDRGPGRRVAWIAEGLVGPDKFEVAL